MSRRHSPEYGWLAYYCGLIGSWAKGNTLQHDAEDAAQDAIASVLGQNRSGILDPKAYLYRSSLNRLRNEIRRQSRHDLLFWKIWPRTNTRYWPTRRLRFAPGSWQGPWSMPWNACP